MENKGHIFNASFYTEPAYRQQWEGWLHDVLIPRVSGIVAGIVTEVFLVQSDVNEGMLVYSVQFRCSTADELETLKRETEPVFNDFRMQFGERVTNFNSVLKKLF